MSGIKIAVLVVVAAYLVYSIIVDPVDYAALKGQRVVVCGASTGIGEQIAYEYSKLGANLVITARRAEVLKKVAAKCQELGASDVHFVPLDLALQESAEKLINESVALMGGIDVVILNHIFGFYEHWTSKSTDKLHLAEKLFRVNTFSYINIATYALPYLEKNRGGLVVVSSFAGLVGTPFATLYSASKHALHGFFNSLRHDLYYSHSSISVTMCVLGFIDTESAVQRASKTVQVPMASSRETALAIIRGGALRQREIYYPRSLVLALYIHQSFPRFFDSFIRYMHNETAIVDV